MLLKEMENNGNPLSKTYLATLPLEEFNKKLGETLTELRKTTLVKGFRLGKAPDKLLKNTDQYAKGLQQIFSNFVKDAANQIIKEHSLKVLGEPSCKVVQIEEGKDVICSLEFELMPQVPEFPIQDLGIKPYKIEVADTEVTEHLDGLKKYDMIDVDAKDYQAAKGDVVVIDFVGKINNKEFKGGTGSNMEIELGSGMVLPKIEEDLVGLKKGSKRRIETTFPNNYHEKSLVGKPVVFQVTLNKIMKKQLITDRQKLAEALQCSNEEELQKKCKESLQKKFDAMAFELNKYAIFNKLKEYDFEVSQSILKAEIENFKSATQNAENSTSLPTEEKDIEAKAKDRVKLAMFVMHLREKFGLKIDRQEVYNKIMQQSMNEQIFQYLCKFYSNNRNALAKLEGEVLEEKVCQHILSFFKDQFVTISPKEAADLLDKAQKAY